MGLGKPDGNETAWPNEIYPSKRAPLWNFKLAGTKTTLQSPREENKKIKLYKNQEFKSLPQQ